MNEGYGYLSVLVNFIKAILMGVGYALLISVTATLLGFEADTVVRDQPAHRVVMLFSLCILEAPLTVIVVFKSVDALFLAARIIFNRVK
ncbi:hypothetical protein [Alcanivorax sp.]|nr:hypothetical protein [Alcanivorax sp.]